jgi:hypothetical protein
MIEFVQTQKTLYSPHDWLRPKRIGVVSESKDNGKTWVNHVFRGSLIHKISDEFIEPFTSDEELIKFVNECLGDADLIKFYADINMGKEFVEFPEMLTNDEHEDILWLGDNDA